MILPDGLLAPGPGTGPATGRMASARGLGYRPPMATRPRPRPDPAALAAGVLARDRTLLSRAITLVESAKPEHRAEAQAVGPEEAGDAR